MKTLAKWCVWLFALVLAGCGGGSGSAGTPILGGGNGTTTATLLVSVSSTAVASDAPATVTAVAKDSLGNPIKNTVVSFTSTGGLGTFTPATALTNDAGTATTQLLPTTGAASGADEVVATITFGTGQITGKTGFTITGGIATGTSDVILQASASQIPNTANSTVVITATAIDANRNALGSVPIQFTADSDSIITPSGSATDGTGKLTASLAIGANRANRIITVTAVSGAVTKSVQVQVIGARIASTLVPAVNSPANSGQVQYRVVDQAGSAMTGQPVQITAAGFTPSQATGTTGPNGDFTYNYTAAPATPGAYAINASIGGASDVQTLQVQSVSAIPVVTTGIVSATVSATPSSVGVNPAGAAVTNRAEVRALFVGPNNQPVPNVRVRFDLAGDGNSVGGSFTTNTTTLYTDANGVVTSAYIPAGRSSPTDGVTIRACYGTSDSDPAFLSCANAAITKLTVTESPVSISIGQGDKIIVDDLTYTKEYLVSVVDASGAAKQDVDLSVLVDLPQYRKGSYSLVGDSWVQFQTMACPNEDTNRNGVLESGEDTDNDGRLDPGKSDVSVKLLQGKTRSDGTAVLQILYAKSFGSWVDATITVRAGVSGTEGTATAVVAPVPVDSQALKNKDVPPAFVISPYGVTASCSNPN